MKDPIKQFVDLKSKLTSERDALMRRLAEINQALGEETAAAPSSIAPAAPQQKPRGSTAPSRTRSRARSKNPISLREAVLQVTTGRPMTKQEIINAVEKLGYTFRGSDPKNVLGTVIYGKNPRFKNEGGKFSPI
jgi:hypothetical protein